MNKANNAREPKDCANQRASFTGLNLLVVSGCPFWKSTAGGPLVKKERMEMYLKLGMRVHLVFAGRLDKSDREAIRALGVETVVATDKAPSKWTCLVRDLTPQFIRNRLAIIARAIRRECPAGSARTLETLRDVRVTRAVSRLARRLRPEIVVVDYLDLAYALEVTGPDSVTVIDTLDAVHLARESFLAQGMTPVLDVSKEEEARAAKPTPVAEAAPEPA